MYPANLFKLSELIPEFRRFKFYVITNIWKGSLGIGIDRHRGAFKNQKR